MDETCPLCTGGRGGGWGGVARTLTHAVREPAAAPPARSRASRATRAQCALGGPAGSCSVWRRDVSGQYGERDETCPVSTGRGTRRVRSVRGEGRDVSGQHGERDETCSVSTGRGTRRVRSVRGRGGGSPRSRPPSKAGRSGGEGAGQGEMRAPSARDVSRQYGERDETCPDSTGRGTRRVRSVMRAPSARGRGAGRDARPVRTGGAGRGGAGRTTCERDAACPISAG
jgi:hypothetical protein